MRKLTVFLSLAVMLALLLAACRPAEVEEAPGVVDTPGLETPLPDTGITTPEAPAVTPEATVETPEVMETPTVVETPTVEATAEVETPPAPVLPGTGLIDPSRLSNLMGYDIRNANGDVLGNVNDMVVDLGEARILHVIVGSGGFLGIGERLIPIPWEQIQLNPACITAVGAMGGTGATAQATPGETGTPETGTGAEATPGAAGTPGAADFGATLEEDCFFLLNVDEDTLREAPNLDMDELPDVRTPGWDTEFNDYWMNVTTGTGTTAQTTPEATGTPGTGTTAQAEDRLILASDLLGMEVVAGTGAATGGTGTTGGTTAQTTPEATGTPGTGTGTTAETTPGAIAGERLGTISDAIIDVQTGDIRYYLISADLDEISGQLVPVPAGALTASVDENDDLLLSLNVDREAFVGAPLFDEATFPIATVEGWDTEIRTYWQTHGFDTTTP